MDLLTRLHAIGVILARRMPVVLTATIALLEAVLEIVDLNIARERMPTAPVALTAERVLEAARARGVLAVGGAVGERLILLASLGLDLSDRRIRDALIELHQLRELRLARIGSVGAVRADLAARGLRIDLVDESAIGDVDITFHAVVIS